MKRILLIALVFGGCAIPARQFTKEQSTYLDAAMAQPTTFSVPTSRSSDIWGRMQVFIADHSPTKIQTATDYVLQTYNPNAAQGMWCGYTITRTPIGDSTKFAVTCYDGLQQKSDEAGRYLLTAMSHNAHVCAYYAMTAKEVPAGLAE